MKTLSEYIDKLKDVTGSDYATAKALGITKQSVSVIRKGGNIKDETAIKIADLLKIERNEVLIAAAIARSTGEVKTTWETISRMSGIMGVVMGTALIVGGLSSNQNIGLINDNQPIIYIMRNDMLSDGIGVNFAAVLIFMYMYWSQNHGRKEIKFLPYPK